MTDHDHDEKVRRFGECLVCVAANLAAQPPEAEELEQIAQQMPHFDGATYRPADDHVRLTGQIARVFALMRDGEWRTLAEIAQHVHDPEASISARLRDLRKDKFGGHTLERRHRGPKSDGLYEYRLILAGRML